MHCTISRFLPSFHRRLRERFLAITSFRWTWKVLAHFPIPPPFFAVPAPSAFANTVGALAPTLPSLLERGTPHLSSRSGRHTAQPIPGRSALRRYERRDDELLVASIDRLGHICILSQYNLHCRSSCLPH